MRDPLNTLTALYDAHGDDLPLDEAAVAIACHEDPTCDGDAVIDDLDTLARLTGHPPGVAPGRAIGRINEVLFSRFDFRGDADTYHSVDNSLIHRVLGRRKGMPITLSLVYAEVARRLDVELDGVGFPGHFVLRPRHTAGHLFIDPFHRGRILQEDQMWALFEATHPDTRITEATWQSLLKPVSRCAFAQRIVRNLKASHGLARSAEGLVRASELLLALGDGPHNHRDMGLALAQMGETERARDALATYLAMVPDASDAASIATRLSMLDFTPSGR